MRINSRLQVAIGFTCLLFICACPQNGEAHSNPFGLTPPEPKPLWQPAPAAPGVGAKALASAAAAAKAALLGLTAIGTKGIGEIIVDGFIGLAEKRKFQDRQEEVLNAAEKASKAISNGNKALLADGHPLPDYVSPNPEPPSPSLPPEVQELHRELRQLSDAMNSLLAELDKLRNAVDEAQKRPDGVKDGNPFLRLVNWVIGDPWDIRKKPAEMPMEDIRALIQEDTADPTSQLISSGRLAAIPAIGTLIVPNDDRRILVRGDEIMSASIVYADGTAEKLEQTPDGAYLTVYDTEKKKSDEGGMLVILQRVGPAAAIGATIFSLVWSDKPSGRKVSSVPPPSNGEKTATMPPPDGREPFQAPPLLKMEDVGPVPVEGSSLIVSAEGENLLGSRPTQTVATLENKKKIIYPNLQLNTNAHSIAVFDGALTAEDIGEKFEYKVKTSEGKTSVPIQTAGLSGVRATPATITKGVVSGVFVDPAGFANLTSDTPITFNLTTTPGARLVSPPTITTTKGALAASGYRIGDVTGIQTGEHKVIVRVTFPTLQGTMRASNYRILLADVPSRRK